MDKKPTAEQWQKCPICNGVGQVSGGYFTRAGDCETWMSSNATEVCRVCEGKGIIRTPKGKMDRCPEMITKRAGDESQDFCKLSERACVLVSGEECEIWNEIQAESE